MELKEPKCSIVREANGTGRSGASGRNDDEARSIVVQIAQKSSTSFAGCSVGICCDEEALDVVTPAMTEPLVSFSRWICPNERTSCSAIAASASQVLHRLLVRTQRIGKTRQLPLMTVYSGVDPGQTSSFKTYWRAKIGWIVAQMYRREVGRLYVRSSAYKRTMHFAISSTRYRSQSLNQSMGRKFGSKSIAYDPARWT
jgi:hypothetical protein